MVVWLLLRAQSAVAALEEEGDAQVGVGIVQRAMEEPLRQILINAGAASPDLIIEQARTEKKASYGFNAQTMEHMDLVKAGVVDPTKVVCHALQNAASGIGFTANDRKRLSSELPEDDGPQASGGGDF